MQAQLYKEVNDLFGDNQISFMNHGYAPAYHEVELLPFKHQLSLYSKAVENLDLNEKIILETGCGRGGGAKWLSENKNIKEYYACDICVENVDFCNKYNYNNIIKYSVQDAQKLNYPENFFDIVFSIESSHGYENLNLFFENVSKVLKNDGTFVLMDIYGISDISISHHNRPINYIINEAEKFFKIEIENITENVKNACYQDVELMKNWISDPKSLEKMEYISGQSFKRYGGGHRGFFKMTGIKK